MLQLEVISSHTPAIWLVNPIYTIGSGANDIYLSEPRLEQAHIQLEVRDRQIIVCEMGAPVVPILINGASMVGKGVLQHKDILTVGQSRIEITDSQVLNVNTKPEPVNVQLHWHLLGLSSALGDHTFIISNNAILGRDAQCDIVLRSQHVSKQQARFVINNNQLGVIDLSSSNGTYVNKQRIKQSILKEGDHIMFGALPFRVVAPKEQPKEDDPNKTQLRRVVAPKPRKKSPPINNSVTEQKNQPRTDHVKIDVPAPKTQKTYTSLASIVITLIVIAVCIFLFLNDFL